MRWIVLKKKEEYFQQSNGQLAIQSLLTGKFPVESVYVNGKWKYPAGVFHGAAGGPC